MSAIVCYHADFDHGTFLRGEYDAAMTGVAGYPMPRAARATHMWTDEDQIFKALAGDLALPEFWNASPDSVSVPITGWTPDRIYHVDEATGEAWTLHPETGAALSSHTWEFEEEPE